MIPKSMKKGDMNEEMAASLEDLPYTLNAQQVASFLGIARSSAYTLMHSADFPTMHIGRSLRVSRDRFIAWLDSQVTCE